MEKIMSQMGHTTPSTYHKHYHNTRTAEQAAAYWSIYPTPAKDSKIISIA